MWPQKKMAGKRQEKHVARVLKFGDDQCSLMPFLKAAENGREFPLSGNLEFGRGKRSSKPARSWSSDSEDSVMSVDEEEMSDKHQNKKRKETRRAVERDALNDLRRKLNQEDSASQSNRDGESVEVKSLKDEVRRLKEENEALRNSLCIVKELPELLKQLAEAKKNFRVGGDAVNKTLPTVTSPQLPGIHQSPTRREDEPATGILMQQLHVPSTPIARPASPSSSSLASGSKTPTSRTGFVPIRTPKPVPQTVFNHAVDADGQVDLGFGVLVNATNLQFVSRVDCKKTTYTLCETVFTRMELANSSLTGKKSNAFKDKVERPRLDDQKVAAVIRPDLGK